MLNESDAVNRSTANGATTVFPYTFKILDESEIEVLANDTVLTLNTHYTVSGVGVAGGGNITTVATYANGTIITRRRNQPTTQTSNYTSETFPPERIERDLDKLAMLMQQAKEMFRRCLMMKKSSSTVDQYVDTPVEGSFARAKVGGGIDWATVVSAGSISVPVSVVEGGTGVTTATGTGSVVKQDSPTINTPTITGLDLSAVAALSMTGGINEAISTIASSATPDIFATSVGNTVNYTGTTPATGFTAAPQAGAQRLLICAGAAPFVAGANMLIDGIASGSTFTAAAGDKMLVVAVTTTQFRLTPMKYDGTAVVNPLASLTSIINPIINGNMEVWQRGTSFVAPATNTYTADRWSHTYSTSAVFDINRSTSVPTVAQADVLFNYSLEVDVTTADAAVAAGDYVALLHKIEGYNWRHFAQRAFTISFWVYSTKTGVFSLGMTNTGADANYVGEYTVDASNTWEKKTVVVLASPSAGTWNYTTGQGLNLYFVLMAGSNWTTTPGSWLGANDFASTNQVNAMDSASNYFRITGVKMELGSTASPIQYIPFEQELARCLRYYQKSFPYATAPAQLAGLTGASVWVSPYTATTATRMHIGLAGRTRSTATVTTYNPSAANGNVYNSTDAADDGSVGSGPIGDREIMVNFTPNAANTVGDLHYVHWTADAEL